MRTRHLVPFVLALLALAWALGSLSRSSAGESLLANSFWLLYILELTPFLGLGAFVLLIALTLSYFMGISDSLGYGIARKMKKRKKRWALRVIIVLYAWGFVFMYLIMHCNGLHCSSYNNPTVQGLQQAVGGSSNPTLLPSLEWSLTGLTSLVPFGWFLPVMLGLLLVCSATMARTFIVAARESRLEATREIQPTRREGFEAVQEAIKTISDQNRKDPKSRIIDCYHRLITTASGLRAGLTPDQTARELEASMRRIFLLEGQAIHQLTLLFEEARYSLHTFSEVDAIEAQEYLVQIAQELNPNKDQHSRTVNASLSGLVAN